MGGLAFVVRKMTIDFLGAALMDDIVTVVTRPKEMRGASMTLAQEIRRGDDVLITADVTVAAVREGRAVRIPDHLRAALSARSGLNATRSGPGNPASSACARPVDIGRGQADIVERPFVQAVEGIATGSGVQPSLETQQERQEESAPCGNGSSEDLLWQLR